MVNERYRGRPEVDMFKEIAKKHGWKFSWVSEMKEALENHRGWGVLQEEASEHSVSARTSARTKTRLDSVPQGMCKNGCGRSASAVSQFCCTGCYLGFGHDVTCLTNKSASTLMNGVGAGASSAGKMAGAIGKALPSMRLKT